MVPVLRLQLPHSEGGETKLPKLSTCEILDNKVTEYRCQLKLFNIIESILNFFIRDCKNPKENAEHLRLWDEACYPAKVINETRVNNINK